MLAEPEAFFKRLDTNGDGSVSKEEFATAIRKMKEHAQPSERSPRRPQEPAGHPGRFGAAPPPAPEEFFSRMDKNHDGKLTKDEVPEGLWQNLSRADANHDGAVSKEELATVHKRMAAEHFKRPAGVPGRPEAPDRGKKPSQEAAKK